VSSQVSIVTCGSVSATCPMSLPRVNLVSLPPVSVSWLILTRSQFLLILFNLVLFFVIFVQFTKFNFYINVILKILFLLKFTFILNISFIIFIPNITILLKGNYYIYVWFLLHVKNMVKVSWKLEHKFFIVVKIKRKILHYFLNDKEKS